MKAFNFKIMILLFLLSLALGVLVSVTLMALTNSLVVDGVVMYANLIRITIFFLILSNALTAVCFSHLYAEGKTAEFIFLLAATMLMGLALGYILYSLLQCNFNFNKLDWYGFFCNIIYNFDLKYYGISLAFWIAFIALYCIFIDKSALNFLSSKGKLGQVEANLENSRWLNSDEFNKMFKPTTYSQLGTLKKDGIPVVGELIKGGKDMKVAFNSPCHSIIIGSTGSGKTTTFVSPMIQMLGATAAGSSMVITDPKGELFSMHSQFLKERGYDVKVVDLRDTYSSYRWNPLDSIWDMYQDYLTANKKVFLRRDTLAESGLKPVGDPSLFEGISEFYEFNGNAYPTREKAIESIKIYKKKRFDEVYEDLNDLCSVLIPVENDKDPMWEKGARSIVFAVLLAMLEDSENPDLGMTKDRYNFFNMTKILQASQDDYKELRFYFKGRRKLSKALALSKQVCDCAETTRASYMSIVYEKLTMFNDAGICALTSASDFSSGGLAERPTALFLKIPDEKDTRHNLAAIFILNIYKTLIKIASATEELTLPRNVYFIMDEFGNMPKIEKFDKFITVGRSRKIWFNMIVQSYAQLNNVYGETVADIIKGNCGIKMFIGSNDANTCKEYSELCGNITVVTRSQSFSGNVEQSTSTQTQVRPLIYPSELQRLNHPGDIGHSIIVTFGNYPLKTYFTPSFKVKLYKMGKMDTQDTEHFFDEKKIAYLAQTRNKIVYEELNGKEEENSQNETRSGYTLNAGSGSVSGYSEEVKKVEASENASNDTIEKPEEEQMPEVKEDGLAEEVKKITEEAVPKTSDEPKEETTEVSGEEAPTPNVFDDIEGISEEQKASLEEDMAAFNEGLVEYLKNNPEGSIKKYVSKLSMDNARIKRDEARRLKAEEKKLHPELYADGKKRKKKVVKKPKKVVTIVKKSERNKEGGSENEDS